MVSREKKRRIIRPNIVEDGSRAQRRYYGKLKGLDGRWTTRALDGCRNVKQAEEMLADAKRRVRNGEEPFPKPIERQHRIGDLFTEWAPTLTNISARSQRWRLEKHLRPRWGRLMIEAVNVRDVLAWIDEMAAAGELKPQTQIHNLNLLSKFYHWAIERGHANINPVAMVPRGRRPRVTINREQPWIEDDDTVLRIVEALPEAIGLLFWIGNRCGLRPGEAAGLRISDLDELAKGAIRVRYSYGGLLKEDKLRAGKVKWTVAPKDAVKRLGPWLARRKAQGAGPEDLLFPYTAPKPQNKRRSVEWKGWGGYHPHHVQEVWKKAAQPIAEGMTWYQATRHSFASRNLTAGATLDEVSAAMGHSSPVVTRKRYDHFIRKDFSAILMRPMRTTRKKK